MIKVPWYWFLDVHGSKSLKNQEYHHNLVIFSLYHYQHFLKGLLISVHIFLSYFAIQEKDASLLKLTKID